MAKPEHAGKPEHTPGLGKEDAPGQNKDEAVTLPDEIPIPPESGDAVTLPDEIPVPE